MVTYPGGYVRSRTTLLGLTWQSGDPETGVVAYRYGLTTDPAQPVFGPETPYSAAQGTLNLTNLNLAEGTTGQGHGYFVYHEGEHFRLEQFQRHVRDRWFLWRTTNGAEAEGGGPVSPPHP